MYSVMYALLLWPSIAIILTHVQLLLYHVQIYMYMNVHYIMYMSLSYDTKLMFALA